MIERNVVVRSDLHLRPAVILANAVTYSIGDVGAEPATITTADGRTAEVEHLLPVIGLGVHAGDVVTIAGPRSAVEAADRVLSRDLEPECRFLSHTDILPVIVGLAQRQRERGGHA
ncbi:HPr family phosphocarrier protein [Actinomycetospora sp. CA-053990]|uniref:HPr family phosphocarrier protein n=1 Tax=Actinomycetospora sp. CA-053990 TaxID=3239891 RepID=UPI003D8C578B